MSEICSTCGLPKELCVCETIAKESQKITVFTLKKKFGKVYTAVEGISNRDIDIKEITKRLKNQLACGGTFKDQRIELQGNHIATIRDALVKLGFAPETIETRK
jgi:translation initiation factor 1